MCLLGSKLAVILKQQFTLGQSGKRHLNAEMFLCARRRALLVYGTFKPPRPAHVLVRCPLSNSCQYDGGIKLRSRQH